MKDALAKLLKILIYMLAKIYYQLLPIQNLGIYLDLDLNKLLRVNHAQSHTLVLKTLCNFNSGTESQFLRIKIIC